jgi:hypothetical protein
MTRDSQETLIVLNPHQTLQLVSVFLKLFWIAFILKVIQQFLSSDHSANYLPPFFNVFVIFFISLIFWVIINTLTTSVVVKADGILQQGFLWKTYIAWDAVKKIVLRERARDGSRFVEIYAKRSQIPFNNKISFDTLLHRNAPQGIHYVLGLAKEYNVQVKTSWFSPPHIPREVRTYAESQEHKAEIEKLHEQLKEKKAAIALLFKQVSSQVPLLQALEVESSDTSTLIDKYLEALAEVDSLESETLTTQCLEALLEVQRLELELFILQQQQYLDSSE